MSSTQAPSIRQILESNPELDDIDFDQPGTLDNIVLGDGEGGEGVDYRQGHSGEIAFTKTWGLWVLRHGTDETGEWTYTYTVHPDYRTARAAYIAEVERMQAEGVAWEPDVCPIWDRLERAWK